MGLITLDQNRRIDTCLGTLVSWLTSGSHASEAIPVLTGLEDVLEEIDKGQRPSLALPRIAIQEGALADKVVSLEVMPAGEPGRLQVLVRDDTDIASLEQSVLQQRNELAIANDALLEAKRRAELALQEKSMFLANVSHDLKTPLQVIMGNAEILRGDLPKTERDLFLQDVLENSNFLLAMITDLLDASVLDAGQVTLTEEPIDISELLERAHLMARNMPSGERRHYEFAVDSGHQVILVDPMRFQRLLLNLLSNAVKFTVDGGHIKVSAELMNSGELVIQIEDDGVGIDPVMMKRVFEPFTTGNAAEGSGLGLHIAKGIADLHGADLSLASEPGSGTIARLCLPSSRVMSTSV